MFDVQTWQKLITVAVLATIVVVAGTIAYFELSPKRRLIISTTTSLYDTGLLDQLEKDYEAKHTDVDINIISAGTGIAIQHAQNGDADLILVHAPAQELTFLEQGWGLNRKIIAYNYFTIVGPENDPANIKGKTTSQALRAIANYGGNLTSQGKQKFGFQEVTTRALTLKSKLSGKLQATTTPKFQRNHGTQTWVKAWEQP